MDGLDKGIFLQHGIGIQDQMIRGLYLRDCPIVAGPVAIIGPRRQDRLFPCPFGLKESA
jgi:hypothetical protein